MPLYDYACANCGAEQEIRHTMTEEPEVSCPDCRSKMYRQISAGHAPVVVGGTPPSHVALAKTIRHHEDMAHAQKVVSQIRQEGMPKARRHLAKVLDQRHEARQRGEQLPEAAKGSDTT